MLNFCSIVVAILKMETGRNFSMSGINSGRWNRTMLNFCGIVAAILKMVTGRNFSMSGINSGHHNLPTYEMALKLSTHISSFDDIELCWLYTHISHFDDIGQSWIFTAHILCRVLAAILKMADISKFVCLYHYPFRSYQH